MDFESYNGASKANLPSIIGVKNSTTQNDLSSLGLKYCF